MFLNRLLPGVLSGLLLGSAALAKPLAFPQVAKRDVSCGDNGPDNRACWKNDWDINTDYEVDTPPGVTRTVSFLLLPSLIAASILPANRAT